MHTYATGINTNTQYICNTALHAATTNASGNNTEHASGNISTNARYRLHGQCRYRYSVKNNVIFSDDSSIDIDTNKYNIIHSNRTDTFPRIAILLQLRNSLSWQLV